jgi:hypothetical protein
MRSRAADGLDAGLLDIRANRRNRHIQLAKAGVGFDRTAIAKSAVAIAPTARRRERIVEYV